MITIAAGDEPGVRRALHDDPDLAARAVESDASDADQAPTVLQERSCYLYRGDTALHIAAAAHRATIAALLLKLGARVNALNRRGTSSLHCAAAGNPDRPDYDPRAQWDTIDVLLTAGADPDITNIDGVTPLHRAIRSRCSAAVAALLDAGASPTLPNGNGSTPLHQATHASGRGGSGSPIAKTQQATIISLLKAHPGA